MVIDFLRKVLGGSGEPEPGNDLEAFVAYVVKALVDAPEKVSVTMTENNGRSVIQIECEKSDIGKVIGKNGRTIAAIRALVNGAASNAGSKRVQVEVLD